MRETGGIVERGRVTERGRVGEVQGVCGGTKVLSHPTLLPYLHRVIDVTLDVSYRISAGVCGGELHFVTISCSGTIGGVCPHVVVEARRQASELNGESAEPRAGQSAVNAVIVDNGRVMRGTPAETAFGDGWHAIVENLTATCGRVEINVRDGVRESVGRVRVVNVTSSL